MLHKVKKFFKLPIQEQFLFFEAYGTLGLMRLAILTISFKKLTSSLQHYTKKYELREVDESQKKMAYTIGKAIERAALHTPWESACLAQAFTAQKMLQKRGIPGVFYLGIAKSNECEEKMKAHAWSQCGNTIITGARGHKAFTVLSVFGW